MNLIATCGSDTTNMGKVSKSPLFARQDRYEQDECDVNETGSRRIDAGTYTKLERIVRNPMDGFKITLSLSDAG